MTQDSNNPYIANSSAVASLAGLPELLGRPVVARSMIHGIPECEAVLAWGRKPSAHNAARFAARNRLPLVYLEDGFLRSIGVGNQSPPLSIVLDDLGIYYDATAPSRLELLVARQLADAQKSRARALISDWRKARVSKYNHAREFTGELPERYVLVADQTMGDASIRYGLADESSFQRMLAAALAENPDCTILLKIHPEVLAGRKRGHFDHVALSKNPRIRVLGADAHPVSLIEHAQVIYAVTSQIGFEGMIWGKRVRTYGMPFYAGWGLTQDELPAPERRKVVPLENLVHAALLDYPRYIDPETGSHCDAERVIEWMGLQRQMRERFPALVYATGFSIYKRPIVRKFFQGSHVKFVNQSKPVTNGTTLIVWGRREVGIAPHDIPVNVNNVADPQYREQSTRVLRLEDGFLRSVGLGADLIRPLSWVVDDRGIYYDATQPSALEVLLQTTEFTAELLTRAASFRQRIASTGLTKYNVGSHGWQKPVGATRIILVPGQVESDASLRFGAPGIRTNLNLLRAVREANPDAYLLYKPHPDVVAGLRRKGQAEDETPRWCDEEVMDVNMGELLQKVDEVHTLTSLAGFEALLRAKKVVCYGQPFYAGWGLTTDIEPVSRRNRSLSLDMLVAGALFLYPVYISRTTGQFTTPEHALDELLAWRKEGGNNLPWWGNAYRFLVGKILRKA